MEPSWARTLLLLGCSALLRGVAWAAEECIHGNGVSYRGSQRVSSTGAPCLSWLDQENLTVSETHNYCRNPDGDAAPWCYVRGEAGAPERRFCSIPQCPGTTTTAPPALIVKAAVVEGTERVLESANDSPAQSEAAAVQPVVGISQRVKMRPNEKKDLGTLGYVLGLIMMSILISIGAGIAVGYVYKRQVPARAGFRGGTAPGRDLKQQHEQKVYEREMQRITLPLSAFTNQACELVDEDTIVVHTNQTPVEELREGDAPLMGQAGTPGA
ncbi:hypothetical protein lerEdw1_019350 [Lerista edwardsae]|nr:hypothetical protein lerEdw1_019350 [Lerista edwardsae]